MEELFTWLRLLGAVELLVAGLFARMLLSISVVLHSRTTSRFEGLLHANRPRQHRVSYWTAVLFCVAGEVATGLTLLLGGALLTPVLGPAGVALDKLVRWVLLGESRPRDCRAWLGIGMALGGAVLAATCMPSPPHWDASVLALASQQEPFTMAAGSVALLLLLGEFGLWMKLGGGGERATLLAMLAAGYGSLHAVTTAAACCYARGEWINNKRLPFCSPLLVQLVAASALFSALQGLRLSAALRQGEAREGVLRLHSTSLVVGSAACVMLLFAADEREADETDPHLGFQVFEALFVYCLGALFCATATLMIYRPPAYRALGPERVYVDSADASDSDRSRDPFPSALRTPVSFLRPEQWRGEVREILAESASWGVSPRVFHPNRHLKGAAAKQAGRQEGTSLWRYIGELRSRLHHHHHHHGQGEHAATRRRRNRLREEGPPPPKPPIRPWLSPTAWFLLQGSFVFAGCFLTLWLYSAGHVECLRGEHRGVPWVLRKCSVPSDDMALVAVAVASVGSVVLAVLRRLFPGDGSELEDVDEDAEGASSGSESVVSGDDSISDGDDAERADRFVHLGDDVRAESMLKLAPVSRGSVWGARVQRQLGCAGAGAKQAETPTGRPVARGNSAALGMKIISRWSSQMGGDDYPPLITAAPAPAPPAVGLVGRLVHEKHAGTRQKKKRAGGGGGKKLGLYEA